MPGRRAEVPEVQGFAPLLGSDPRVLILGTMPGVASLALQQYYAQSRNAFWRIMGELFAAGPELDYPHRTRRLTGAGIAVWDVLARCARAGSLDSAIVSGSEVPNDIASLLLRFPQIRHIFFNGRKAEQLFLRSVRPTLTASLTTEHSFVCLPSTSPAFAALDFDGKLQQWRIIRRVLAETLE
jgi:double-stranded uracil-DNA glycosylase